MSREMATEDRNTAATAEGKFFKSHFNLRGHTCEVCACVRREMQYVFNNNNNAKAIREMSICYAIREAIIFFRVNLQLSKLWSTIYPILNIHRCE